MTEASRDTDLSIGEHFDGHIPGRPISWVVVVLVCGGFIAGGIGLIIPVPWLFIVGIAVVAVATVLGWATHAMADISPRVETTARLANAAERQHAEVATGAPAAGSAGSAGDGAEGGDAGDEPARGEASIRG